MPDNITWSLAEDAVGRDEPDSDWKLDPMRHAETLKQAAAPLKRVLLGHDSNGVPEVMKRYVERDANAEREQKRYRARRSRIRWFGWIAAVSGFFALSTHFILGHHPEYQLVFVLLHVVAVLTLIFQTIRLNVTNPRRKWLAARGEAEQLRVALFKRVLAARQPVHPGEIKLLPLQLAYFRRYQLDVQLRYFEGRGKELSRIAGCSAAFTSLIVFAVAMATLVAIAMFLHVAHEHGWLRPGAHILTINVEQIEGVAWWAFLALALSSLYAVLVAQQDVTEDERNGARYLTHHANLSFLRTAGYEQVRRAAEADDRPTVERYVQLVHEVLIAEQAQWISFTSMVETGDRMLAESSAVGLAELFADRFGARANDEAILASTRNTDVASENEKVTRRRVAAETL